MPPAWLDETQGTRRIVVEKPFGTDLASARRIQSANCTRCSPRTRSTASITTWEKRRFRTCLVLRFANTIFEPVWNRNYIEHVEITAAESLTVGHRGGLLRYVGRAARHVSGPSAAVAVAGRDGDTGAIRSGGGARREGEGPACRALPALGRRGIRDDPGPVSWIPRGTGRAASQRHRHVRGRPTASSTIGAGKVCRSICEAAKPCRAARRSSSSSSGSHPTCCSRAARTISTMPID